MASILRCKELSNSGLRLDERGVRRYTRVFQVVTDDAAMSAIEVQVKAADAGLPQLYQWYTTPREYDLGATVRDVSSRRTGDPRVWEFTVEYSSEISPVSAAENPAGPATGASPQRGDAAERNPTLRVPTIRWGTEAHAEPAVKDVAGNPIANSAFEQFDPPPEMDKPRGVLTISKAQFVNPQALAAQFRNKVNEDTFFGCAPLTVKCQSIDGDSQFENNLWYWQNTYTFHIREEGWFLSILDAGYSEVVGGEKRVILDKGGLPLAYPSLLAGDGTKLAPDGNPFYLQFQVYLADDFGLLNLP